MLIFRILKLLSQSLDHVSLALLVHLIAVLEELLEDFNFVCIPSNFVVPIKQNEVRAAHACGQSEVFHDFFIRELFEIRYSQFKVDRIILVELLNVCNFVILCKILEEILVVSSPHLDRQLPDYQFILPVYAGKSAMHYVVRAILLEFNPTGEPAEPRYHPMEVVVAISQSLPYVVRNLQGIVAGDARGPTGANAFSTVDKAHREDRGVVVWLNALTFLHLVGKDVIIILMEDEASESSEVSKYVTRRCCLFPTHHPISELTYGH